VYNWLGNWFFICANGKTGLANLCAELEIHDTRILDTVASIFKIPLPQKGYHGECDGKLLGKAEEIYTALIMDMPPQ